MRRPTGLCLVFLLPAALIAGGVGLVTAAPPAGKKAALPRLLSVKLAPAAIILSGPQAAQRIVVTGRYSDGSEADVTPQAKLRLTASGVAALDAAIPRLISLKEGKAEVVAQVGALTAKAPVTVADTVKAARVSFQNDLIPVFTRIGCNNGACHGQQNGQGGFKLSLRGWDAAFDHEQIVKADNGKRIDLKDVNRSLILTKPTGQVSHGGGPVLKKNSAEYRMLLRWINEGKNAPSDKEAQITDLVVSPRERILPAPGREQRLLVTALFSDGSRRDVTGLARYQSQNDAVAVVGEEGRVQARGPGESAILISYGGEVRTADVLVPYPNPGLTKKAAKPAKSALPAAKPAYVDDLVARKLAKLHIVSSGRATDSEFLRRVYLDTTATLPTPDETRAFLRDADPGKRAKLIDRLLERPEFVDYRTLKLADLLRVNGQYLSEEGADIYYRWIRDRVAKNVPYDQFVRELLTARGSTYRTGPANYFRVARTPEDLAETTSQSFLGTRLACAKCHNHPFENWKQRDYYGLAAFFARFGIKGGPEFGEEQIFVRRDGEVQNPRIKQNAKPRFLGGAEPTLTENAEIAVSDRRAALVEWMTARDNRHFARVAVNRIWADYFGRGIVDPVDDFRISNPPANGPLLDALAKDFIAHNYDVKHITRVILNSATYQRSSVILPGNARDDRYFARVYPRRLPAEALLDAIGQVTGKQDRFWPYPQGWRATQIRDSRIGAYFLEVFGRPKREILCACERSPQPNLSQSLHLINSGSLNNKIAADDSRLAALLKQFEPWAPAARDKRIVEELYYLTLCRPPSKSEGAAMLAYVAKSKERRKGFEDALWALLNSEEFLFNK